MCFGALKAQPLYTEAFNYAVGALSNDATGAVAGKGGWFIQGGVPADYNIVNEPGKGNVLKFESITDIYKNREVFRTDLGTHWQQRSSGNNILKLAFDFYTGGHDLASNGSNTDIVLSVKNNKLLSGFQYYLKNREVMVSVRDKSTYSMYYLYSSNGQRLILPKDTWLTFEIYIDYYNNKAYYSIPALNYTVAYPIISLSPNGNSENDGVPAIVLLKNEKSQGDYTLKFDNINISAQNTVPVVTVGINEVLRNSFNLYPNPATNIVTITNNANKQVQQIRVYDITGKLISTHTYSSETTLQLNVENLAAGAYTLHLATAEGTAIKKFIKK